MSEHEKRCLSCSQACTVNDFLKRIVVQITLLFFLTHSSSLSFHFLGQSLACVQLKMYSFSPSSPLLYFFFAFIFGHLPPLPMYRIDMPLLRCPPWRWPNLRPPLNAHPTLPVGPAHKLCPSLNGHLTWHLVIECPRPMPTSSTTTTTTTITTTTAVQCQCISPRQQWPRAVCPTNYCLTAWLESGTHVYDNLPSVSFFLYTWNNPPPPQTPPPPLVRDVYCSLCFFCPLKHLHWFGFVVTVDCPCRESLAAAAH